MTKEFDIDTEAGRLTVSVCIECRDRDGADATFEIEGVWDVTAASEIKWEALAPNDQVRINVEAERLADDWACEAAQDFMESAADAWHDRMQDGDT